MAFAQVRQQGTASPIAIRSWQKARFVEALNNDAAHWGCPYEPLFAGMDIHDGESSIKASERPEADPLMELLDKVAGELYSTLLKTDDGSEEQRTR